MTDLLPTFPVDQITRGLLREALNATLDADFRIVGAEFSMGRLLEFMSGGITDDGYQVVYTRDDVIRALLDEIDATPA